MLLVSSLIGKLLIIGGVQKSGKFRRIAETHLDEPALAVRVFIAVPGAV